MKVPTMIRRSITAASDWSREAMNSRFDFLRLNRQLEERREQHILRSCVCVDARMLISVPTIIWGCPGIRILSRHGARGLDCGAAVLEPPPW